MIDRSMNELIHLCAVGPYQTLKYWGRAISNYEDGKLHHARNDDGSCWHGCPACIVERFKEVNSFDKPLGKFNWK